MLKIWLKRLARLYMPVYHFESDGMKVAYAGYSSSKRNYFVRFILKRILHQGFSGRKWFWKLPELFDSENYDLIISEISPITFRYFQKCNGFILPEWVRMYINIDKPLNEIIKRQASDFSDVIRKIRKYNLTYEIQTDKESFDIFNEKFYRPFIAKRHGEEAWIEDLNMMWNSNPSPFLIAIREDGRIVGMSLVRKWGETFSLFRVGLLHGNEEYRRRGVIGALYYFSMLEGRKMGCRYFDVGGTRPFLNDGLTKFKIGLGAEFNSEEVYKYELYLWLSFNKNSARAREFIQKNRFMHLTDDYRLVSRK